MKVQSPVVNETMVKGITETPAHYSKQRQQWMIKWHIQKQFFLYNKPIDSIWVNGFTYLHIKYVVRIRIKANTNISNSRTHLLRSEQPQYYLTLCVYLIHILYIFSILEKFKNMYINPFIYIYMIFFPVFIRTHTRIICAYSLQFHCHLSVKKQNKTNKQNIIRKKKDWMTDKTLYSLLIL